MNNLKPVSFLLPFIALILIVIFFIVLLKEAGNKAAFKRLIFIMAGLAFLLNFTWEVTQMPLYKGAYDVKQIAFCALASVADALMVLLLYMSFALLNRKPLLVGHLTSSTVFLMMLTGSLGAILAEKFYVASGNWTYSQAMPIIPVANVGLSPVLQFMILPILIYYLSFRILKREIFKN